MYINFITSFEGLLIWSENKVNNVCWVIAKWKRWKNVDWMLGHLGTSGKAILKRLVIKKGFSAWTKK